MRRNLSRIPIPLMLALAVAVGVTVVIVIQVTILAPPPAVVAPIESKAESIETGTSTISLSLEIPHDGYAIYPTLIGLGKLQLETNTSGWYYYVKDWLATVVRRSQGDAVFTTDDGYKVYVKEINQTHAFILYRKYGVGVVAKKVQVGSTGWIVYHPVATDYDTATVDAIKELLSSLHLSSCLVFQPKPGYVEYNPSYKRFYVYFDRVTDDGKVDKKDTYFINTTNFEPLAVNTPVTITGIERISMYDYVLYSVWGLLYHMPTVDTKYYLKVTPVK